MKTLSNIAIAFSLSLIIGVSCQKERIYLPQVTAEIIYVYDSIAVATSEIISDGNADITAHGFCWSSEPEPTLNNNFSSFPGNMINIIDTLKGLRANTRYFLRAYATNSLGTVYGKQLEFSTLGLPHVRTLNAEALYRLDAAYNRANLSLTLLHNGNTIIDTLGFCYSTKPNPDINDSTIFYTHNSMFLVEWKSSTRELLYGTTYYVRSFATNVIGTSYGEELKLTTLPEPPIEPEETIIIADIQYASYQNNWYIYDNETWRQLVNTSGIVLIPKEGIKLEEKDFGSIGIHDFTLTDPRTIDSDIYYWLTLPDGADHIALALALWDTGWLKYQRFSSLGFFY